MGNNEARIFEHSGRHYYYPFGVYGRALGSKKE
jgi:hypothetical protein